MAKKLFFDFMGQVMTVFAFTIIMLNIFCMAFGSGAQDFSAIFALGNAGIPVNTAFQFLGVSFLIVGIRFIFTSDLLIKKMPDRMRMLCMLALIFIVIVIFVVLCGWFPVGQKSAWLLFLACYIISFLGSCFLSVMKMESENKQLQEALQRLQHNEK